MKIKIVFLFLIVIFLFNSTGCQAFLKKKQAPPAAEEKMPETKEEWEIQAQNIPLKNRELEPYKEPEMGENVVYSPRYTFELYNNPPGTRKLNIEDIKKNLYSYPYIVSDSKCRYAAYPRYYYSPDINQISSEFFVEKLDTSKFRIKRMLDYNHNQKIRTPILVSGKYERYKNLFGGLSLVDWSKDGKKLLIKECIGSTLNGIYKTYLYIHYRTGNRQTVKLDILDTAIKKYCLNHRNIQIIKYRYDIEPLGFSKENDNVIIVLAYVYDKNNEKILLGSWSYDIQKNKTTFLSPNIPKTSVSANGLILIRTLN